MKPNLECGNIGCMLVCGTHKKTFNSENTSGSE